jgi:hypothetical protein
MNGWTIRGVVAGVLVPLLFAGACKKEEETPETPLIPERTATAASTTAAVTPEAPAPTQPVPPPVTPPAATPSPQTTTKPTTPTDAGAAQTDAGAATGAKPPFVLPSGFPPLPSSLPKVPGLPTALPTAK